MSELNINDTENKTIKNLESNTIVESKEKSINTKSLVYIFLQKQFLIFNKRILIFLE